MSYAPTIVKQAGEARIITFDFTNKLALGDTIASVVGGVLEATGIRISCRVTTTLGETLELDVDVRIADGEN